MLIFSVLGKINISYVNSHRLKGISHFYGRFYLSRLPKLFERLSQFDLLILDDFAIKKLTAEQVLDLMEIIEDRHGNKSTVFASQLPVANWYETLDSNASASAAILDRIINIASRFTLKGDSLRKKH